MGKLVVFDLDGTLVDSRLDLAGAVNYVRSSLNLEMLETERIVSFVGNGQEMLLRRAIGDAEIDFETAKFYLDSEKQGTIDKIVNRYEVRPHHTVLMCVSIVVTFVCVILLMPDILYGLDWLIGFIKELDIFKK